MPHVVRQTEPTGIVCRGEFGIPVAFFSIHSYQFFKLIRFLSTSTNSRDLHIPIWQRQISSAKQAIVRTMGRIEDWAGNACGQAGSNILTTRAPTATSYKRQEIERSHFNPTTNCEKLSDVDDVIAQQPFWY